MIPEDTLEIARRTVRELRERGPYEQAQAIEALVEAADEHTLPSLDLLTTTQAGDLLGVSGQTIKYWVRQGDVRGFRVGGRFMIPRDVVADYVRRAGQSLDLEEISDEEAAFGSSTASVLASSDERTGSASTI